MVPCTLIGWSDCCRKGDEMLPSAPPSHCSARPTTLDRALLPPELVNEPGWHTQPQFRRLAACIDVGCALAVAVANCYLLHSAQPSLAWGMRVMLPSGVMAGTCLQLLHMLVSPDAYFRNRHCIMLVCRLTQALSLSLVTLATHRWLALGHHTACQPPFPTPATPTQPPAPFPTPAAALLVTSGALASLLHAASNPLHLRPQIAAQMAYLAFLLLAQIAPAAVLLDLHPVARPALRATCDNLMAGLALYSSLTDGMYLDSSRMHRTCAERSTLVLLLFAELFCVLVLPAYLSYRLDRALVASMRQKPASARPSRQDKHRTTTAPPLVDSSTTAVGVCHRSLPPYVRFGAVLAGGGLPPACCATGWEEAKGAPAAVHGCAAPTHTNAFDPRPKDHAAGAAGAADWAAPGAAAAAAASSDLPAWANATRAAVAAAANSSGYPSRAGGTDAVTAAGCHSSVPFASICQAWASAANIPAAAAVSKATAVQHWLVQAADACSEHVALSAPEAPHGHPHGDTARAGGRAHCARTPRTGSRERCSNSWAGPRCTPTVARRVVANRAAESSPAPGAIAASAAAAQVRACTAPASARPAPSPKSRAVSGGRARAPPSYARVKLPAAQPAASGAATPAWRPSERAQRPRDEVDHWLRVLLWEAWVLVLMAAVSWVVTLLLEPLLPLMAVPLIAQPAAAAAAVPHGASSGQCFVM